ncbi:hypothetical protein GOBAR_AA38641 [Gossypium barbadense]|uniref:Uncharacterized protein n=1 Tax=Gossypium barbadense TaxID=3634 RepID=A0A2P5VTA7_GOSBA|nr:hypothetical protein GOBAR_AA38641 [Gossypium barbadense]
MAQRGPWWCGCELPTETWHNRGRGPDNCSIFCRAIMPYFIRLLACTGASVNICNVGHPVVRVIRQHRHLGASDVRERWAEKSVPVENDNPIRFTGFYGNAEPTKAMLVEYAKKGGSVCYGEMDHWG